MSSINLAAKADWSAFVFL